MGWEIVGVPGNPPCDPFIRKSTVDVIASVVEPKLVNTRVRNLGQVAPLENLHHVKRVKRRNLEGWRVFFFSIEVFLLLLLQIFGSTEIH